MPNNTKNVFLYKKIIIYLIKINLIIKNLMVMIILIKIIQETKNYHWVYLIKDKMILKVVSALLKMNKIRFLNQVHLKLLNKYLKNSNKMYITIIISNKMYISIIKSNRHPYSVNRNYNQYNIKTIYSKIIYFQIVMLMAFSNNKTYKRKKNRQTNNNKPQFLKIISPSNFKIIIFFHNN